MNGFERIWIKIKYLFGVSVWGGCLVNVWDQRLGNGSAERYGTVHEERRYTLILPTCPSKDQFPSKDAPIPCDLVSGWDGLRERSWRLWRGEGKFR
jgi:hypothetical protein